MRIALLRLLALMTLAAVPPALAQGAPIRLATTTSTANSGLLDRLLPVFTARHGHAVQVIAVGSGAALAIAARGDADAVLAHDREAEDRFVAAGHASLRRDVMYNDFVIAGVREDPASIRGTRDAVQALLRIRERRSPFVSRGDNSGTHVRELQLWKLAGVTPAWEGYYLAIGQGMGTALVVAWEKRGYVLTDRGTLLSYRGKSELEVMVEGDARLFNPYGIMAVNPARHPRVNHAAALALVDWIVTDEARAIIAGYRIGGQPLFFPAAR